MTNRPRRKGDSPLLRQKLLIIKLQYVGDTMGVLPTVEILRRHAPGLTIDVLIHKESAELIAFYGGVRKVWEYDRQAAKRDLFSTVRYHMKLIRALRRERYDLVIALTQGDRVAFLSFATGAPLRLIIQTSNKMCRIFMNAFATGDARHHHFIEQDADILTYFGIEIPQISMKIQITDQVRIKIREQLRDIRAGQLKVAIHPGARKKTRRWAPDRFAEIARRLHEHRQAAIILLGGRGDEGILEEIENRMGSPAAFKSCELSLLEMAAIFSECHLFIGNDSGPGHIAAAANCTTLSLFGPNYPDSCRPYIASGEVIFKNLPCLGLCRQEEWLCIRPDNTCMDLIGVDEVWEKVQMILARTGTAASGP